MARYTENRRERIDEAVELWKLRCLLGDDSLVFDERAGVWSGEHADEMYRRFNENLLEGPEAGDFLSKWEQQLADASDGVRLFAAELLLVHFLFAGSVSGPAKLRVVRHSLEGTDIELPGDALAVQALWEQIGHPGIGFNTRRDIQVAYLIDFTVRWKRLDRDEQERLLGDPWALREFADATTEPIREMRHILLHLMRPDEFERISSGTHKREIAAAFSGLLDDDAPADVDERLYAIRQQLENYLPQGNTAKAVVDFYHPPLRGIWESAGGGDGDGTGDLEALLWKKQIVLYGPPGTSKTYQARRLAETLIRRAALDRWQPRAFFERQAEIDRLVDENLFWVQLHPAYGYEEFIRGLRLEGDETRYRPGLLPHIVAHLEQQQAPQGLPALPAVLVLDEINRADLSRMLGEAFSLLENDKRGQTVPLPGLNPGDPPETLVVPTDLYVIGTMNEIDQSVETLDFALRRRFLWRECPFERDTLLAIVADRWERDVGRFSYDEAAEQLERLADRAVELNAAIEASEELGRQYQVGHTYFADIAFFLGVWLRGRSGRPPNATYLWTARGRPQPPLNDLWERSLRPLLAQHLAGSDVRDEEMRRLEQTFKRA
jgi:5-methylcytosine-specific restriction enzyme B